MGRMKDIFIELQQLRADNDYLKERINHLTDQLEKANAYIDAHERLFRNHENKDSTHNSGTV